MNNTSIFTTNMDGIAVHAINCGRVKVKTAHRNPSLGAPMILLDPFWTEWLPIWVWVIEHPEGIIVVDTGENQQVTNPDYFDGGGVNGWINRKILQFDIRAQVEIGNQLKRININPDAVRWVVLTHLHIDHTDGLLYFPRAEVIVSKIEFSRPYGSVPCTFPKGFSPRKIDYTQPHPHFGRAYPVTSDGRVRIVPTPGHSHGHQSVIFSGSSLDLFLAGDTTFSEQQLKRRQIAGICVDKSSATRTLDAIRGHCLARPTIYLPTHEWASAKRLQTHQPTPLGGM